MKVALIVSLVMIVTQAALAGGGFGHTPLPEVTRPEVQCRFNAPKDAHFGERFTSVTLDFGQSKGEAFGRVRVDNVEVQSTFGNFTHLATLDNVLNRSFSAVSFKTLSATRSSGRLLRMNLQGISGLDIQMAISDRNLKISGENAYFVTSPRVLNLALTDIPTVFVVLGERIEASCSIFGNTLKTLLKPNLDVNTLLK